jgi:hypothetical protein
MKTIALCLLLIASLRRPEVPDPPINNHEELIARIETKFIGNLERGRDQFIPPKLAKIDWVTPEYRPVVIDYLKKKSEAPEYLDRARRVLIALGDDETILAVASEFAQDRLNDKSILWQNLNGSSIKYMIPIIYDGSEARKNIGSGDIIKIQSPRREGITYALTIISASGLFNPNTYSWAAGMEYEIQDTDDDPHIMWLFQQWWEHNKNAIMAKKYSEATWLPLYKGKVDKFSSTFRNEPEYRTYTKEFRNDILPIPKHASIIPNIKAAPPATKADPVAVPVPKNIFLFVILALGLSAIVTAVWAWSKRIKGLR